jgi:uncharacterized protein YbjT (DUF2867 family)
MRVILFGATGMVGAGVLQECLEDPSVGAVLAVGRRSCGVGHAKLRGLIRSDFFDYSDGPVELDGYDACFFCLGVSAAGMSEARYHRVTYDLTMAAARAVSRRTPSMTFCYVSGEGTNSSEGGRLMWARVKGKTENALLAMPLNAFMFRPGYIHPRRGVRSPRRLYRSFHFIVGPFFPLLHRLLPAHMTTTENIGRAMIRVARSGYSKRVLENPDIDLLAAQL